MADEDKHIDPVIDYVGQTIAIGLEALFGVFGIGTPITENKSPPQNPVDEDEEVGDGGNQLGDEEDEGDYEEEEDDIDFGECNVDDADEDETDEEDQDGSDQIEDDEDGEDDNEDSDDFDNSRHVVYFQDNSNDERADDEVTELDEANERRRDQIMRRFLRQRMIEMANKAPRNS